LFNFVIYYSFIILKRSWKDSWLNSRSGDNYQIIMGFSDKSFEINNISREEERIISRLRLLCCGLNAYLFKLGIVVSNMCPCCGVPEDVSHFLLTCSKHQELQNNLKSITKDLKIAFNLNNLLNNNATLRIIAKYAIDNKLKL